MKLEKLNLITKMDRIGMFDQWGCPKCRYKIKVRSFDRPIYCPKCPQDKSVKTVPLGWWSEEDHECPMCKGQAGAVTESHPLAALLRLGRDDGKRLFACASGCTEQIEASKLDGAE